MEKQTILTWIRGLMACWVMLLLFSAWLPVVSPGAQPVSTATLGVTPTLVPQGATPTVAPDKSELEKEYLQKQNDAYLLTVLTPFLTTCLSTGAILITAVAGFWRWRRDHRIEREKREEDTPLNKENLMKNVSRQLLVVWEAKE